MKKIIALIFLLFFCFSIVVSAAPIMESTSALTTSVTGTFTVEENATGVGHKIIQEEQHNFLWYIEQWFKNLIGG